PLDPQFAAEDAWHTPLRSQQPEAQFAGPHFSAGAVRQEEKVASAAETSRSLTRDMRAGLPRRAAHLEKSPSRSARSSSFGRSPRNISSTHPRARRRMNEGLDPTGL